MTPSPEAYDTFNAINGLLGALPEEQRHIVLRWISAAPIEKYKDLLTTSLSGRAAMLDERHRDWNRYRFLCGWNEGLGHAGMCLMRVPELHEPPPPREEPK